MVSKTDIVSHETHSCLKKILTRVTFLGESWIKNDMISYMTNRIVNRIGSFLFTSEMKSLERYQFWEQYLLILIGRNSGEDSFWKGECFHSLTRWHMLDRRKIISTVFTDDMDTWLVFVHRMKNNLWQGKKSQVYQESLPNLNTMMKYLRCKMFPVRNKNFQGCRNANLIKYTKNGEEGLGSYL